MVVRKIHPEALGRWCKRNSRKLVVREELRKSTKKDGKAHNGEMFVHLRMTKMGCKQILELFSNPS